MLSPHDCSLFYLQANLFAAKGKHCLIKTENLDDEEGQKLKILFSYFCIFL